jgi:ribonuclease P protein component
LIGRIVRSVDFERVMAAPSRAKTRHFVLHHLAAVPSKPRYAVSATQALQASDTHSLVELSTADLVSKAPLVDDSLVDPHNQSLPSKDIWLGLVVPKRHAKRSVTRQLLKRQMRAVVRDQQDTTPRLAHGLWVLRLRAAFDVKQYPSAASTALAHEARQELVELLRRATGPALGLA